MKTNLKYAILCIFIFFILSSNVFGQDNKPSVDPEREVIVMFAKDAILPPHGLTRGAPSDFIISSEGLKDILIRSKVETISRLIPDFVPEDKHVINHLGHPVELTDWANVYVLILPNVITREKVIEQLVRHPEIIFAEINGRGEPDVVPNDQSFNRQWTLKNDGTSLQGSGIPGADINATQAWDITTGSSNIKIGIVDIGMQTNHPDFTGRVTGDGGDNSQHGTAVAGVAAAKGNNSTGVAGVAWNVSIINEDYGGDDASDADFAAAILSASNRGANVINNSWKLIPVGRYSVTVRLAFADVYKLDRIAVVAMGNQGGEVIQYPAAFGKGIITVGATTNEDQKADYSSTGSWIDVTAPGGAGSGSADNKDDIYTTFPGSSYGYQAGASFSTPVVSGIAALLLSYNSNLYNDDIEQIIRLTAEDLGDFGFDNLYGTGRVNAYNALKMIMSPNQIVRLGAYTGGTVVSISEQFPALIHGVPGLQDGNYIVKRYEVIRDITFPQYMTPPSVPGLSFNMPQVWGNGTATTLANSGLEYVNKDCSVCCDGPLIYGLPHTEVVPGTVTHTGARLRSYVYRVYTRTYITQGVCVPQTDLGYFPTSPSNVQFAATVVGIPGIQKSNQLSGDETPQVFSLEQNYPNPFNPTTTIRYALPKESHVTLRIYNTLGQEIIKLVNEAMDAGYHETTFDATSLTSGVYFYKIQAGNYNAIRKLLVVK